MLQPYFFPFFIIPFMAAIFIVAILLAVWVYRDAERRGESGVLWLIIVLITGIIGLIIWLIVRSDKPVISSEPATKVPPPPQTVQTTQKTDAQFCPNCGAKIQPNSSFCANCGASLE
ncbi:MAG: zinc-ribbon domain-containing protein [Promethearchaeota archaeon]